MGQFDEVLYDLEKAESTLMQLSEQNKRLKIELEFNNKMAASREQNLKEQRQALLEDNKLLTFERDAAKNDLKLAGERIKKLEYGYMNKKQRDEIENLKREVLYFMQLAFAQESNN